MNATIETLSQSLPDYAKDIRLNLAALMSVDNAQGLTQTQIHAVALASAYATKQSYVIDKVLEEVRQTLDDKTLEAVKSSATIMAMTNIYYRFLHLVNDADYASMPAGLRMSVIGNPGIAKADFELCSLAVSVVNGCGYCVESHAKKLNQGGISKQAIQTTVKIASVMHATAQACVIEKR